jgi:MFS family permease
VLVLFGSAALVLTAWVAVELRHPHPLIDLRLVSKREIAGVNGAAFAMAMGMFMALTLVSRLAQTPTSTGYGLGASLSMAGLLLLPISVGSIASQPIARRLSARHGPLRVLAMGATLVSATLVVLAGAHGNVAVLLVATTLFGVGLGSTMAVMPAVIVANVPPHRTGSAISLNQVLRNVGGAFGSALTATVLAMHQTAGAAFPRDDGYVVALLVAAGACMAAAVLVVALAPRSVGAGALDARNAPSASGRRP